MSTAEAMRVALSGTAFLLLVIAAASAAGAGALREWAESRWWIAAAVLAGLLLLAGLAFGFASMWWEVGR